MKKFAVGIVCALLLVGVGAFASYAQTNATIQIVKPIDRHNVPLDIATDVTVAITGVSLDDGYGWQVLIDGVPEPVVHGTLTTSITVPDPSGPHRIRVALLDPQGNTIATNEALVMAAPLDQIPPAFNRAWFAPAMGIFTLIVIAIIILGLCLRPRRAAWQD